ncbi:MAG: NAD(P)H-hydrate dehydratase [Christensenellales bacterium]
MCVERGGKRGHGRRGDALRKGGTAVGRGAGDGGRDPFAALNTVQAQAPCAMAKVVPDGAELGTRVQRNCSRNSAKGKAALAIGPGLGRTDGSWPPGQALVRSDTPKVIDADALFLLAKHGGGVGANTGATPHPGEMARLCDTTVQAVLAAPVGLAQQLAADLGACVLLKGATTIIAQGEDVAMNIVGRRHGTGGCGDAPTGVIACYGAGHQPYGMWRVSARFITDARAKRRRRIWLRAA